MMGFSNDDEGYGNHTIRQHCKKTFIELTMRSLAGENGGALG